MRPRSRPPRDTGCARSASRGIILQPEMRDLILAHEVAQCILELRLLNEQVVLRLQALRRHGTLEIERQPFLYSLHAGALREVHEQREIQDDRGRKNRVATEKV